MNKKALPFITILAIVVAFAIGLKIVAKKYQSSNTLGLQVATVTPATDKLTPTEGPKYPTTLGNFLVTSNEVCLESGKPIIYFFGTSGCPHCIWEKPIVERVAKKFETEIVFKEKIDFGADPIYEKYFDISQGYVPFMVLGCKYLRLGGGENLAKDLKEAEKLEEEALTVIICKLTKGEPASVCNSLKEKVAEVK